MTKGFEFFIRIKRVKQIDANSYSHQSAVLYFVRNFISFIQSFIP